MKIKNTIISVLALSLGLTVGATAFAAAADRQNAVVYCDDDMTQPLAPQMEKDYKLNSNGESYGSGAAAVYVEDMPDLIRVLGDNGIEGYVYASEMIGEPPSSPEEAIKLQEERISKNDIEKIINVYDCEGETVIDTYTIKFSTPIE